LFWGSAIIIPWRLMVLRSPLPVHRAYDGELARGRDTDREVALMTMDRTLRS
jgi:hypothetical protein